MNERNLLERTKALTFNVFLKASFVPGRLIVNKIKGRRFTLAGFILLSPSGFRRLRLSANVWRQELRRPGVVRSEIERMRSQVARQRKEILQL